MLKGVPAEYRIQAGTCVLNLVYVSKSQWLKVQPVLRVDCGESEG